MILFKSLPQRLLILACNVTRILFRAYSHLQLLFISYSNMSIMQDPPQYAHPRNTTNTSERVGAGPCTDFHAYPYCFRGGGSAVGTPEIEFERLAKMGQGS